VRCVACKNEIDDGIFCDDCKKRMFEASKTWEEFAKKMLEHLDKILVI